MRTYVACLALAACGDVAVTRDNLNPVPVTCGTGTHLEDKTCVADLVPVQVICGSGTQLQDDTCVADTCAITHCDAGTHQVGDACVPDTNESTLVGTWTTYELGSGLPFKVETYGSDGSYTKQLMSFPDAPYFQDEALCTGTWTLYGPMLGVVSSCGGVEVDDASAYYQNGDSMAFSPHYPIGEHDGILGTWRHIHTHYVSASPGEPPSYGCPQGTTYTFFDDGTYERELLNCTGTGDIIDETTTGTYALVTAGEFAGRYELNSSGRYASLIDDAAVVVDFGAGTAVRE